MPKTILFILLIPSILFSFTAELSEGSDAYARRPLDPRVKYPLAYVELRDNRGKSRADMMIPHSMSRTFSLTSSGIVKSRTPHALLGLVVDAKKGRDGSIISVQGAAFEMTESKRSRERAPFEVEEQTIQQGKSEVARFDLDYGYASMQMIHNDAEYGFFHPLWDNERFGPTEEPLIREGWDEQKWEDCGVLDYPLMCPCLKEVGFVKAQKPWVAAATSEEPGLNYASFLQNYPDAEPVTMGEARAKMLQFVEGWNEAADVPKRFVRKFRRDWARALENLAETNDLVFCDKHPSVWKGFHLRYSDAPRTSHRCYYVDLDDSTVTLVQHGEG